MNNSIQRYHDIYGDSYREPQSSHLSLDLLHDVITLVGLIFRAVASRGYDRDPSGPQSGYVALTNVPKHVGSLIFSSAFQTSISKSPSNHTAPD